MIPGTTWVGGGERGPPPAWRATVPPSQSPTVSRPSSEPRRRHTPGSTWSSRWAPARPQTAHRRRGYVHASSLGRRRNRRLVRARIRPCGDAPGRAAS